MLQKSLKKHILLLSLFMLSSCEQLFLSDYHWQIFLVRLSYGAYCIIVIFATTKFNNAVFKNYIYPEFVVVGIIRQVCLLDLTADFGIKTKAKLTPNYQLQEKSKTGVFRVVCTQ